MLRSLSRLIAGAAAVPIVAAPGYVQASDWDHHFFHWSQELRHQHLHEELARQHALEHFFRPGMHPHEHWMRHHRLWHQHQQWHHGAQLEHDLHHSREWHSGGLHLWWHLGPGITLEVY